MGWAVSCIAFSGFFLRSNVWSQVAPSFRRFICLDHLRDQTELSMADYLDQAERALLALHPPYLLLGHSFGALPARCLAQRLPPDQARLAVLAGLVLSCDQSAAEAYDASGQLTMAEYCRLDLASGRIALRGHDRFVEHLYAPAPAPVSAMLAEYEPLSLMLDTLPLHPLDCPTHYVVCLGDKLADVSSQYTFAKRLGAACLKHDGGHMGPLLEQDWLEAVCAGWRIDLNAG